MRVFYYLHNLIIMIIQPIIGNKNHRMFKKLWLPSRNLRIKIAIPGINVARLQIVEMIFNFNNPAIKTITKLIIKLHKTTHQ